MPNNRKYKVGAFTLVELIVVIVILSILATIAFLSFGSQASTARDSTRLSDVANIGKGLGVKSAMIGNYPFPDLKLDITASGNVIGYQGYAGESVLRSINASNDGFKDPIDNVNYTYMTNAGRNKFQVMAFLENKSSITLDYGNITDDVNATSYTNRYPYIKGDTLGVILVSSGADGSLIYTPVQDLDIGTIRTSTGIDLTDPNIASKGVMAIASSTPSASESASGSLAIVTNNYIGLTSSDTGTTTPSPSAPVAKGTISNPGINCLDILNSGVNTDGSYYIKPDVNPAFEAYCDMSADGGGWTLVAGIEGSNTNHVTDLEFTPSNLTSSGGFGKYSDSIINAIKSTGSGTLRLQAFDPSVDSGGAMIVWQYIFANCTNFVGNGQGDGCGEGGFPDGYTLGLAKWDGDFNGNPPTGLSYGSSGHGGGARTQYNGWGRDGKLWAK